MNERTRGGEGEGPRLRFSFGGWVVRALGVAGRRWDLPHTTGRVGAPGPPAFPRASRAEAPAGAFAG